MKAPSLNSNRSLLHSLAHENSLLQDTSLGYSSWCVPLGICLAYILLTFETRLQAVLLHRMQNIVIPSPRRSRRAYRTLFHQTTVWDRIHAMILPLDIPRTTTRLILHILVYFLTKMLLVWIVLAKWAIEKYVSRVLVDFLCRLWHILGRRLYKGARRSWKKCITP